MKKILRLLLIVLISLFFISCEKNNDNKTNKEDETNNVTNDDKTNNDANKEDPNKEDDPVIVDPKDETIYLEFDFENSPHVISDAIKNYDLSYNPKTGNKLKQEILDIITKEEGFDKLEEAINSFDSHIDKIKDLLTIVETLSYAYYEDEDIQADFNDLYAYYIDLDTIYTELEVEIAKSIYASDYFSDLTIDEIEELASQEVDNEELNRLLVRKNEISTIYYSSNNPDELLKEFVEINKRIAELNGYERDEYILYSDECEYSREYSLLDVETLSEYILDYFFDLEYEVYSTVIGSDDQEEDIINAYVGNTILENKDILDKYVNAVGGTYKECYYDLWENGYYVIASGRKAEATAFQDKYNDISTIYIGPYYDDIGTFVHEFGHYHTSVYDHDYFSYDLLETHSQGSEVLLRLYLLETHPGFSSSLYEKFLIENFLFTIVVGEMVREYETILYTTEVEDIKELWEEFVEDYGLTGWEDEEGLIISYDNYYFSYSTSAIAALEFYAYGKEHGFEAARDKYLALCNYDGDGDLVEALAKIGFGSPFSEDVVKYIYDTIMDTIEDDWSNYIE